MKIKEIYKDSEYITQLKAPILNVVLYILIAATSMTVISSAVTGLYAGSAMLGILNIFLIFSSFQNRRGNYDKAAVTTIYALAIIVILARFANGYDGEHSLSNAALTCILIIFLCMFFSPDKKHLYIITGLSTLYFIAFLGWVAGAKLYSEHSAGLLQQLTSAVAIFPVVAVLAILFRNIMDKVLDEALHRITESRDNALKMTDLANEASEKLQLAQSMNDQARETVGAIKDIETNVNQVTGQVGSLSSQYDSSRLSLQAIADTMTSLDSIASEQSDKISETSAALEEIVASIKNVSAVIGAKSESVQQLRSSAEEGVRVISNTTTSFDQVLGHIDNVKQMVSLISGISSQTNLLAMNAAIEAAHAGDAGKGFAVVADEVRKLAESSSQNTKEVSDTLKKLIAAIEETGGNVKSSGLSFSSIGTEVAQVGLAMDEIIESIRELSTGSDEILTSTAMMKELTTNVVESVQNAKENEKNASDSVSELGKFINSLSSSMSEISGGSSVIHNATLGLSEKCNIINDYVQDFSKKLN